MVGEADFDNRNNIMNSSQKLPIAVVTGVSRGIGSSVSVKLLERGFTVVGVARAPATSLDDSLRTNGNFVYIQADLTKEEGLLTIDRSLKELCLKGWYISLVVNNAGTLGPDGPTKLYNLQSTDIDFVLSLNVSAPMKLVNLCLPHMISGGRILNVTSRAGSLAIPDGAAYCLTKAALDMYTRCLSLELKEKGVSAASVIPGEVDTDMQLVWRVTDCDLQGWFTKNKAESLLIAPQVTAKFFAFLLCDLDATAYNSHEGPFSIYDEEHHSYWKLEEDLVPSVF